jgi:hypothetical protein
MMQARQSIRLVKPKRPASRPEGKPAHSKSGQDFRYRVRSGSKSEDRVRFGVLFAAERCVLTADSRRIGSALYAFACSCSASAGRVYLEAPPEPEDDGDNVSSERAR